MNRMNRAASTIVLVTLVGCGGGSTSQLPVRETGAGCVTGTERITKISGDGQAGAPAAQLPEQPTARFTCQSFANGGTMPMTRATVQWQVVTRGRVDGATTVQKQLDADGTTSVVWTLPNGFGAQAVSVALAGGNPPLRAQFNATVAASTTTAQSCADAGGTEHGAATVIAADAAWPASGSPHRGGTILLDNAAVLSIEAGAVVCVAAIDRVDRVGNSGALLAEGSAQAPIRFVGTALRIADTLTHVRAENVLSVGSARPATRIEDSTFRWTVQRDPGDCAQVIVATDGTVRGTLIERYGSPGCAALRAGGPLLCDFYYCYSANATIEARIVASLGDGVSIDGESDVSFTNCQVSTSAGHGIVVAQTNTARVFVHRCNLFDNLGDAIANRSALAVAAPETWWGDPSGPSGPGGDGTSGLINTLNPLAGPLPLDY